MRISDMVKSIYQKEQVQNSQSKTNFMSANSDNWVNPHEDPNRNITNSTAHKRIVPIPTDVANQITDMVKKEFLENNAMSDGEEKSKMIRSYLASIPSEERSAANWTLNRLIIETGQSYRDKIREHNPTWQPGEYFDTKILEGFAPSTKQLDVKV